jgi:hypothetical protein
VLRRRALRAPAVEQRLIAHGADAVPGTPREPDGHVRSERARFCESPEGDRPEGPLTKTRSDVAFAGDGVMPLHSR